MKRVLSAGLLLFTLAACKDSTSSGPKVASLTVTPDGSFVQIGQTIQLSATAKDASGVALPGVSPAWQSLNPQVATVNGSGLVTGAAAGTAQIAASAGGKADTVSVNVSATPLVSVNVGVNSACSDEDLRQARVVATSRYAIILEDTKNPSGGFSTAEYQDIADTFDSLIWPTDTENFGTPSDIDKNGKVFFLYTTAVNALTPANVNYVVGGFFFARDLFPKVATPQLGACAGSNEREIFYLLAPDPQGTINGNARSKDAVLRSTFGTVPHEFEHLINSSRRLFVNNAKDFEETWLDEGLAHIAEELTFYAQSGLAPKNNYTVAALRAVPGAIDAFNRYAIQNFLRLQGYYKNPASNSPYATNDELATRGAAWGLLRYSADRQSGSQQEFWKKLVNSQSIGLTNFGAAVGTDPLTFVRDWEVSVYTDDAVPNIAARYMEPSWVFRDVMSELNKGVFPLNTTSLAIGTNSTSLLAGTSAYFRFGVAPAMQAEIRSDSGGAAIGSCTTGAPVVDLSVGQSYEASGDAAGVLCINGGAAGAEFTYIPFFASAVKNAQLPLQVTAATVIPVVGPPSPNRLSPSTPSFLAAPAQAFSADGGWEMRLRERERRDLGDKILRSRGSRPTLSSQSVVAPATLRVTIVRTK